MTNSKRAVAKDYGDAITVYMAPIADSVPLATFLLEAGTNCKCVERFAYVALLLCRARNTSTHSGSGVVFFTGEVSAAQKAALHIRKRPNFKIETRSSSVLVLSVQGKRRLKLREAREIVMMSPLRHCLDKITLVAVPPKVTKVGCTANAYVQFCDRETAQSMVHSVDAMPYQEYFVHSTQLDASPVVLSASVVWRNRRVSNEDDEPNTMQHNHGSVKETTLDWVHNQEGLGKLCASVERRESRMKADVPVHTRTMFRESVDLLLKSCATNVVKHSNTPFSLADNLRELCAPTPQHHTDGTSTLSLTLSTSDTFS